MDEAPDPERVNEIFNDALELPAEERVPFVYRACGADVPLREEVLGLLARHTEAREWMPDLTKTVSMGPAFRIGDLICNRYRLVRQLGRGGMGEVYEAEDREMGDHVALKTIRREIAAEESILARFRQEIQLGRKIAHPNACHIYNIDKHDSTYFFSMELLRGDTLAARLKAIGRFTTADALPLLSQMAGALTAAHEAGIVHRDFKPGNVMLCEGDPRRRAVVTDFGLARLVQPPAGGSTTGLTHFAGTPAYMAPEQLEDGPLSPATDTYALGLVAYEMVTGKRPFEGTSEISAAVRRMTGTVTPMAKYVPDIDARWNAAILRCLEREPGDRWASASEFVGALTNEQALAPAITIPAQARRHLYRKSWAWAAVLALVIAGAAIAWKIANPSDNTPAEAREWYDKGVAAVRDGVYWKATTDLDKAVEIYRNYPVAYARRAEAWNEMDSPDRAATDMAKAHAHLSALPSMDRRYVEAINSTIAGEFKDAVNAYRAILEKLPEEEKHFGHLDLGRAYEKNAEPVKALEEYKAASAERPHWPGAWLRLGALERKLSRLNDAEKDLRQALELYASAGDAEGQAQAKFEMARVSKPLKAEPLLQAALQLAGENVYQQITIELQQSFVAVQEGRYADARSLAEKAQQLAQDNAMPVLAGRGLNDLGNALYLSGRIEDAKKVYQRAIGVAATYHAERLEYGARMTLSGILAATHPAEAEKDLVRSRSWFSTHGYGTETARADMLLARMERDRGSFPPAIARLKGALIETGDPGTLASVSRDLAKIYIDTENFPAAAETASKSREFDKPTENRVWLGEDDEELGAALSFSGDFEHAAIALDSARQEGFDDLELAIDRAEMALLMGDYNRAILLSQRVLQAPKPDSGDALDARRIFCLAELRLGKGGNSLASCKSAVESASYADETSKEAARLAFVFALERAGDPAAALNAADALAPELENYGQKDSLWRCLTYGAQAATQSGNMALSRAMAAKSRSVLNSALKDWSPTSVALYRQRADTRSDLDLLEAIEQRKSDLAGRAKARNGR